MKRPLTGICIVLILFLTVWQARRGTEIPPSLLQTEQLLADQFGDGSLVTVSGKVTECSTISAGMRLFMDHLIIYKNNSEISILSEIKLTFTTEEAQILPGDTVRVRGKCTLFEEDSNPGQFDARAYYFSKNTVCGLRSAEILQRSEGEMSLRRGLELLRRTLRGSYEQILDEKTAGTIAAISLGEKNGMDAAWKEVFQEGGIAHILAISGLHISLIGMGLYRILRRMGANFGTAGVLSGGFVLLYGIMTGFGVSAVRAVLMFFVWLLAQIVGRKYDMVTAVSLAAALILTDRAAALGEASFLLSFSAVTALAVVIPVGQKACGIENTVGKSMFSSLFVWLGTLPFSLYFFYQTAPWSMLVNLAVVPLMSLVMTAGLASAVTGIFCMPLAVFLAAPVHYLLYFFEWLCRIEQKLPGAVWVTGRPKTGQMILYYAVLLGMTGVSIFFSGKKEKEAKTKTKMKMGKAHHGIQAMWFLGAAVCLLLMAPKAPQDLKVTCLDVGQGDCAMIRFPTGEVYLVDGGSTSESSLWKYRISQAVKYSGISRIDGIFLSHADQDHISGIAEYLEEYTPGFCGSNAHGITLGSLILPPTADPGDFAELKNRAAQKKISVYTMDAGSSISPEGSPKKSSKKETTWKITCLAPDTGDLSGDRNEDSMVLMVQYGSFRMLFTGDLEGDAEKRLTQQGADLRADVLKVGHHGSRNGSADIFLEQVKPQVSVISCGKDNSYGHPAPEVLERLEKARSRILTTMEYGAVTIVSDGETFSIETHLSKENH